MSVIDEGKIINAGIAKMVADPELQTKFMVAMSGNAQQIAAFDIDNFGAPKGLAEELAKKSGS